MVENLNILENLRRCQKESINTISKYLRSRSDKSCLINLPTGAGKSGVICITSHSSKSKRILILTHKRSVCDQLIRQLKGGFYKKILGDDANLSSLKPVFKDINDFNEEGIYCTTVQKITMLSTDKLEAIKDKIDLLIFDEGHAEPAFKWSKAVRKFQCKKIIVTATPYRNDLFSFDIDVNHYYIYTFKEAVTDNTIINPDFESINSNNIINKINEIKKSQPDSVCIIKCKDFESIQDYYNLMKKEFNTLAIHEQYKGSNDKNTTKNVPADIAQKEFEIIIHQNKLDEGVDLPQAKILILTYAVNSGRELVQTVGRVVRLYENYIPYVLDLNSTKNSTLWNNYQEFDEYLSNKNTAKNFIKTLDTSYLIKSYIKDFPDYSYYDSGFMKKFDFENFNPIESLEIPLASVCFYVKKSEFNLADCLDKMYWDFNRQGALSKYETDFGLVVSVTFSNSKFLKDSLFFEPSLEVMIVKELGDDYVAIFDSQGRRFDNDEELHIGRPIDMDTLFKVVSEPNKETLTKQANTRALQRSSQRPESIAYKGSLESINLPASNATYAITTGVFSSLDKSTNKTDNSYYLGVSSGRISDQKKSRFSYSDFINWLDEIHIKLKSSNVLQSSFVRSFAKTSDDKPDEDPSACLLDFTSFENLTLGYKNFKYPINDDYMFFIYEQGFYLIEQLKGVNLRPYAILSISSNIFTPYISKDSIDHFKIEISFNDKRELCIHTSDELSLFSNNQPIAREQVFNKDTIKLMYDSGITFLNGDFFEIRMPTQSGLLNKNLMSKVIPLNCLLDKNLSEKDEHHTTKDNFGLNSIFHQIDKLANVRNNNSTLADLGDLYPHIPEVDLILCTDLGTEPADFILSSKNKLVMVHVKCGSWKKNPQSSAGAIYEVGSQALKNLNALIDQRFEKYANDGSLRSKWKVSARVSNPVELDNRIRLYQGEYDSNLFQQPDMLDEVFEEIDKRRKDVLVKKEVWLVIGNAFSKNHFENQMKNISNANAESKQAYQLIDTWLSTLSSHEVDLKIFVSK